MVKISWDVTLDRSSDMLGSLRVHGVSPDGDRDAEESIIYQQRQMYGCFRSYVVMPATIPINHHKRSPIAGDIP